MLLLMRFSGFFSAATALVVLSPSLQTFPPAEAIRSSYLDEYLRLPVQMAPTKAKTYFCSGKPLHSAMRINVVRIKVGFLFLFLGISVFAILLWFTSPLPLTLNTFAVHSILQHLLCLESIFFHFLISETNLESIVQSTFPQLKFKVYYFDLKIVQNLISTSVRQALEQPLNFVVLRCRYPGLIHRNETYCHGRLWWKDA